DALAELGAEKARCGDADNRERQAVERDRTADNRRILSEGASPVAVTEHGYCARSGCAVITRQQRAPDDRGHSKELGIAARCHLSARGWIRDLAGLDAEPRQREREHADEAFAASVHFAEHA